MLFIESVSEFLQIIGLGTVVMMPLIGNLSDQYGRKALLTLPMILSIIPLGNQFYYFNFIFVGKCYWPSL